jgi:hypothetical protein
VDGYNSLDCIFTSAATCLYLPACLPVDATALGEPCPPVQPVSTVHFLHRIIFYRMRLSAPCPTPILYPLTLPAWVALLVVKLPPELLSGSQSRTTPTTTTRWRHIWGVSKEILDENSRNLAFLSRSVRCF